MTERKVVIIDYGIGNLLSVKRALEYCGADVIISSNAEIIKSASYVILPGVGSFSNGMEQLEKLGLNKTILEVAQNGIPLLGICLGMQLLFESSEEFGITKGLGLIPGKVVSISNFNKEFGKIKVPHIGWSELYSSSLWKKTALEDTIEGDEVYFVHSYVAVPSNENNMISYCMYKGEKITAVVQKNNVTGCQFHPEKSGELGLKILKRFLSL